MKWCVDKMCTKRINSTGLPGDVSYQAGTGLGENVGASRRFRAETSKQNIPLYKNYEVKRPFMLEPIHVMQSIQ